MKPILLLLAAMWASGCASTNVSLFTPQKQYAPVPPDQVEIHLLERDIPAGAEKLGTVAIQFPLMYADSDVQRDVKRACAKIGATGAIRVNEGPRPVREGMFQVTYLAFRTSAADAP